MATAKTLPKVIGWYQPHTPVRYDGLLLNHATGEYLEPPSRTKQEFKDQCDINKIVKSFTLTGQITHISAKAASGAFLDLPDDMDYQTSLNVIIQAENAFLALPAAIRDRFHQDPTAFLAFVADPKNADELVKLGIRTPPPKAPTPTPAPTASPGGSETSPGEPGKTS